MQVLKGIPVASGVAIARPFLLEREGVYCPLRRSLSDAEVERDIKLFKEAVARTADGIRRTKEKLVRRVGKGHGAILDAHLMILKDPMFVDATVEEVRREHVNAGWAFYQNMQKFATLVASVGDAYLRERTNDVEDVGWQVLKYLTGGEKRNLRSLREPVVVIADDLTPSETADIPREKVVGFATLSGSRTSHTAIIAQALEIPAIVGVAGLRDVALGEGVVIVDGSEGLLILDPDEATLERYRRQQKVSVQRRKDLGKLTQLKTETPDGHVVSLLANLELPVEVPAALNGGAEGVGLFRTEFLFLNRDTIPDEEEQYQWYRKVVQQMAPRPVVIRTLDVGGDKFLRSAGEAREMNPFLGLRGIRLSLAHRELFRAQLRAILRASAHGTVEMMFPLISSVEEFRQARTAFEDAASELKSEKIRFDEAISVGVMIETPSAAIVSDLLAKEAKFFSIGSNDLIQYSIAVDRGNQGAAYLYQPLHPAILRLLRMIIDMAHAEKIEVTVCGEIAADPLAGALLLGLGVDALSVSPVSLFEAKRLIRSTSYAEAKAVALEALTLPTAQTVRELVTGRLGSRVGPSA
jgi:phosphotransferase system enzyme I (PtsI)